MDLFSVRVFERPGGGLGLSDALLNIGIVGAGFIATVAGVILVLGLLSYHAE